jgi:putative transposase
MAVDLFDNWFDPVETEVRARAREFIEEMIRGEFHIVLARPRYGRSQMTGNEGRAGILGHRHGSRTRSLIRTFGPIEIAVPRATEHLGGQHDGVEEPGVAGLSAPHAGRRCADREHLSAGTNTRRVRRALAALFGGAVARTR